MIRYNTPHGNLQQGVPLKTYDGIASWHVVRVQVAKVVAFMQNRLH